MSELMIWSGLTLGLIVVLLLFRFWEKNRNSNFLLALMLASIWYSLLINYFNQTQFILQTPVLMRTANITAYLICPFLYLYVRNVFYPGIRWRRQDWLFLLPSLIYIIDLLPFFLSSPAYKISIMKENLSSPFGMLLVREGWIMPKEFHLVFKYLWSVWVMTLVIRLLIRNWYVKSRAGNQSNLPLFWFMVILTVLIMPLIIPGIFGAFFQMKWYSLIFLSMDLAIVLIFTTLFLLFSPGILYGFLPKTSVGYEVNPAENMINTASTQLKADGKELHSANMNRLFLDKTDMESMILRIEKFMAERKPYLELQYTIHDLGRVIQFPVYQLSPIINQYYGSNFNGWINRYRIAHFISLWQQEKNRELTLDALAKESGFSNRTTFTSAFKKEKNSTPALFLKNLHAKENI